MKVLRTRVADASVLPAPAVAGSMREVAVLHNGLVVPCGGGTALEWLEVQAAGKKACTASAYRNSLSGKRLFIDDPHLPETGIENEQVANGSAM